MYMVETFWCKCGWISHNCTRCNLAHPWKNILRQFDGIPLNLRVLKEIPQFLHDTEKQSCKIENGKKMEN